MEKEENCCLTVRLGTFLKYSGDKTLLEPTPTKPLFSCVPAKQLAVADESRSTSFKHLRDTSKLSEIRNKDDNPVNALLVAIKNLRCHQRNNLDCGQYQPDNIY
jgi:hypothetical protein